jgi:hypothetical protein
VPSGLQSFKFVTGTSNWVSKIELRIVI